jgi:hypothetical protein
MSGRGNTTVSSAKNKNKNKQITRSGCAIDYDLRYELIFL